ncbi:hypothetical protein, partial [Acinetobacter baumannii]|uniref:hypothetical protein n=1 Tax=Acinetobacter baumannii TaxID=470 RepID=UPI0039171D27
MNGPNWGKDVFVPLEAIIGGRDMIGKGWMMLMNCLSVGRSISLPATGTSAAKVCSYVSGRHLPLGAAFMNGPNWGKDVFVPLEAIIGGRDM